LSLCVGSKAITPEPELPDIDIVNDNNGDGIPDHQQVDDKVDLDRNGTPDNRQADIKSVKTFFGDGQIGVKLFENVSEILSLESFDMNKLYKTERGQEEMPLGYIRFRVKPDHSDIPAKVIIYFSEPAPDDAKW
jgi:hypothetical protein